MFCIENYIAKNLCKLFWLKTIIVNIKLYLETNISTNMCQYCRLSNLANCIENYIDAKKLCKLFWLKAVIVNIKLYLETNISTNIGQYCQLSNPADKTRLFMTADVLVKNNKIITRMFIISKQEMQWIFCIENYIYGKNLCNRFWPKTAIINNQSLFKDKDINQH